MPNRRDFIKSTSLAAGATTLTAGNASGAQPAENAKQKLFRDKLLKCLGGPWPEGGDLKPEKTKTEQKDGYRLEWLTYELESGDRCPAILLVPDGVSETSPAPAVAIWHQHAELALDDEMKETLEQRELYARISLKALQPQQRRRVSSHDARAAFEDRVVEDGGVEGHEACGGGGGGGGAAEEKPQRRGGEHAAAAALLGHRTRRRLLLLTRAAGGFGGSREAAAADTSTSAPAAAARSR